MVRDKLQINKNEKSLLQMDITLFEGKSKDKMTKFIYVNTPNASFVDKVTDKTTIFYQLKPNYKEDGAFYVSDIIEVKGSTDQNKIK